MVLIYYSPYNYYKPDSIKKNPINAIGHKDFDVDPYIDFGSGKGDRTSLEDRKNVPINSLMNSDYIFGELPRKNDSHDSILGKGFNDKKIDKITHKATESFNNSSK
ncbi:hypothetical protein [Psychrobacter vallis]|uniref:hypothetical protein n=1 Tax=Psychrobacter vallis TaxID=248451 RepID=UPI001918D2EB|nr:hypothetical protein [Psychrobacter vallis]